MLDKHLKVFGLDNNFSLNELEGKYKKLLKEFDTKNIEDGLKFIFLEEQVKIKEAYQALLKHYYKAGIPVLLMNVFKGWAQEKIGQIKSRNKKNQQRLIAYRN